MNNDEPKKQNNYGNNNIIRFYLTDGRIFTFDGNAPDVQQKIEDAFGKKTGVSQQNQSETLNSNSKSINPSFTKLDNSANLENQKIHDPCKNDNDCIDFEKESTRLFYQQRDEIIQQIRNGQISTVKFPLPNYPLNNQHPENQVISESYSGKNKQPDTISRQSNSSSKTTVLDTILIVVIGIPMLILFHWKDIIKVILILSAFWWLLCNDRYGVSWD